MKNITLYTLIPAIALVAFGCSSPTAMKSSEYDDMYYSASDQTQYVTPEANAPQQAYANEADAQSQALEEGEVLNPEYSGSNAVTDNYYGDEYYDGRSYNPRDNWYRPNYSYIDPYWGSAYTPRAYSRVGSRAFYDPFYDPFYADPFYYDPFYRRSPWGNSITIAISYNYGYGGWYRPYAYYSNWYPNNRYYHGYHHNAYANNVWYYDRPVVVGNPVKRQYGPRDARGTVVNDGSNRDNGRPIRGEAFEGDGVRTESTRPATDNARPARPSRGERTATQPETGSETKQALPSRPGRTEYYVPRESRPGTRQPARTGEQQQRPVILPQERRETRTREYTPRTRENRVRTRENSETQPRPVQTRPAREQRRESTPPPAREQRRESNNNSSSSSSSSGSQSSESRGGRPSRGQ